MSMVGDFREGLQDVVARDLKAVVCGLCDLRDDVRALDQRLHEEMAQLRKQAEDNVSVLRERTRQHIRQMRVDGARSIDRTANLQAALKRELETRRNAEIEEQLRQARGLQQTQQH